MQWFHHCSPWSGNRVKENSNLLRSTQWHVKVIDVIHFLVVASETPRVHQTSIKSPYCPFRFSRTNKVGQSPHFSAMLFSLLIYNRMCTRMITPVKWVNCTAQPKHEKTEYNIVQCKNPLAPGHTITDSHTGSSTKKGGICPMCWGIRYWSITNLTEGIHPVRGTLRGLILRTYRVWPTES